MVRIATIVEGHGEVEAVPILIRRIAQALFPGELPSVGHPIRDSKGWLSAHMARGKSYRETLDQPALTARFDLERARRASPSFDKLWRDVEDLLS